MKPFPNWSVVATLFLLCGGCARYEYDLVSPPELSRHIGASEEVLRVEPLEYRTRSYENRLVIDVFNLTKEPITLLGDRSYAVDPRGQSRPLRGQSIAPDAFIKLILPPMRPYYREGGPNFGIGVGAGFSRAYYNRFGYGGAGPGDPFWDEPRYYTYYDESDASYWDWQGETDVRLHLTFQRGQGTFSHDFTFHRKKM